MFIFYYIFETCEIITNFQLIIVTKNVNEKYNSIMYRYAIWETMKASVYCYTSLLTP